MIAINSVAEEEAGAAASRNSRRRRKAPAVAVYDDLDLDWVEIELSQGKWAKVDLADMKLVTGQCWRLSGNGYASTEGGVVLMHRIILGVPAGDPRDIDHCNRDKLDNRRSNLRVATRSQNMANSSKHRDGSSKYKGVYWDRRTRRWRVQLRVNGRRLRPGSFICEEAAARAYNRAAQEAFGEYALLNDVPPRLTRRPS